MCSSGYSWRIRAHSLMDRISGFGPEDLGSIPSGLAWEKKEVNEFANKKVY